MAVQTFRLLVHPHAWYVSLHLVRRCSFSGGSTDLSVAMETSSSSVAETEIYTVIYWQLVISAPIPHFIQKHKNVPWKRFACLWAHGSKLWCLYFMKRRARDDFRAWECTQSCHFWRCWCFFSKSTCHSPPIIIIVLLLSSLCGPFWHRMWPLGLLRILAGLSGPIFRNPRIISDDPSFPCFVR